MDWTKFAVMDVPMLIGVAVNAVNKIKGAPGPEKEAAVIATVKQVPGILNAVVGHDVVNDAAFDQLLSDYISSRVALSNFLTKHAAPPEGVIVPAGAQ